MMDVEKLIEQLSIRGLGNGTSLGYHSGLFDEAATALSALQAENEKLRDELEQVKRLYKSEKEDFIDFACSGVPNLSPYCLNRHPDCVDERGWCRAEKCRGFSRERDLQKEG